MKVAYFSGHKYTLSVHIPILRKLSTLAAIKLFVFDYPEGNEIVEKLEELLELKVIESYAIIPDDRHLLRHHKALKEMCETLSNEPIRLFVANADFTPMHRYFISTARAKGVSVAVIQSDNPTRLLTSYSSLVKSDCNKAQNFNENRSHKRKFTLQRIARAIRWRLKRPYKIILQLVQYKILPFVFTRQIFSLNGYEKKYDKYLGFATDRADVVIVYHESVKEALQYFVPTANVIVVGHPLSGNCRCNGAVKKSKLLVALGGPWRYFIQPRNSAEDIRKRWMEAILRTVSINNFEEVHIRPHPREMDSHPADLSASLKAAGVLTKVLNPMLQSLPEIICDYVGVLGSPSGVLLEAVHSCSNAFVVEVEVEGVQGEENRFRMNTCFDEITSVPRVEMLQKEHFQRTKHQGMKLPKAIDVMKNFMVLSK